MTKIYPWRLAPKLSATIWGGDELVRRYGKLGGPMSKAADVLGYGRGSESTLEPIDYHRDGLDRTALIADRHVTVELSARPQRRPRSQPMTGRSS